jgi:hypothetical protein
MSYSARLAVVIALSIAASSAWAQSYRCSVGDANYLSDRPCRPEPNRTQIGAYGPTPSANTIPYSPPVPGAPRAQEYVKYLGSGCASIIEAIRTGPARGVRFDVVRALQEEYTQKCSLEDQDARSQWQQEKSQQLQIKISERDQARNERQQSSLKADQCASIRDVIALKRRREAQLSPTEVTALRDLEKTYNERCLGR